MMRIHRIVTEAGAGAQFSACQRYRYALWRPAASLTATRDRVLFVMLNPSTADATQDDPTIRRCIGFASAWGFRNLLVANAFALRSTDPKALYDHPEPVGQDNDGVIETLAKAASLVVCAWGTHGHLRGRDGEVVGLLRRAGAEPHHLGLTKDGFPRHPLYLRGDAEPQPWTGETEA